MENGAPHPCGPPISTGERLAAEVRLVVCWGKTEGRIHAAG